MRRFEPDEITRYLIRLDGFLSKPVKLIVIGGTAIALLGAADHTTTDIDLWDRLPPDLQEAIDAAGDEGKVPIQPVATCFPPENFEDRLEPYDLPGLQHLTIWLPEAHDLAMMKLARGLPHDVEGVMEIHETEPLDRNTLIERFLEAKVVYIGSDRDFELKFLSGISELFGATAAEEIDDLFKTQKRQLGM